MFAGVTGSPNGFEDKQLPICQQKADLAPHEGAESDVRLFTGPHQ